MDVEMLAPPPQHNSHNNIHPTPVFLPATAVVAHHAKNNNLRCRRFHHRLMAVRLVTPTVALLQTLNWFIDACALTWGTAVPLGSFAKDLRTHDFYAVSGLLLAEVTRFWMAAFVLRRRYTISPRLRRLLSILQTLLALVIMLYSVTYLAVALTDYGTYGQGQSLLELELALQVPSPALQQPYACNEADMQRVSESLIIFYALIGLNTWVALVLLNWSTTIRNWFMSCKSLRRYHDNLMEQRGQDTPAEAGNELSPGQILEMLRGEYRAGGSQDSSKRRMKVCKGYRDAIWYMYADGRAVERVEAALGDGASDAYEREAAADVVGFWAMMETMEEGQALGKPLLAVHYRQGLLRYLAYVADHNYGPAGSAAAHSFALLFTHSDATSLLHFLSGSLRRQFDSQIYREEEDAKDILDVLLERIAKSPSKIVDNTINATGRRHPPSGEAATGSSLAIVAWPAESIYHIFALQQLVYRLLALAPVTSAVLAQPNASAPMLDTNTKALTVADISTVVARRIRQPLFSMATALMCRTTATAISSSKPIATETTASAAPTSSSSNHGVDLLQEVQEKYLFVVFPLTLQSVLQGKRTEMVQLLLEQPEKLRRRIRPMNIICTLFVTIFITSIIAFTPVGIILAVRTVHSLQKEIIESMVNYNGSPSPY